MLTLAMIRYLISIFIVETITIFIVQMISFFLSSIIVIN